MFVITRTLRRYLEAMAVLQLPLLESTGEYFIVSAASALTSLSLPSFVSASGIIAGRSVSFDGPWLLLEEISLPLLEEVVGCARVTTYITAVYGRYWHLLRSNRVGCVCKIFADLLPALHAVRCIFDQTKGLRP